MSASKNCIGVIDSGVGGITTLSVLKSLLPDEDYIYISDKSAAPYGNKTDDFIFKRIKYICQILKNQNAKAVVIACNTATNVALDLMRVVDEGKISGMLFVGVEPALKPAFKELNQGKILVLLTPVTARQPKFLRLLKGLDTKKIIVSPQPHLATLIEQNINNLAQIKNDVKQALHPHLNQNVQSVVLGCTHYCFVKNYIKEFLNAKIYDSAAGTAVRLYNLLKQNNLINHSGGSIRFLKI